MFGHIAVLGAGLIGASFARAAKARSICKHAVGYGRNKETLKSALDKGYLDSFGTDAAKACEGADLIVMATPVEIFTSLAREISGTIKKGAIVIDVGSVKGRLVRDLESIMPSGVDFVGCHPIAGSERSGMMNSDPDIFNGALCILTPTERTGVDAQKKVKDLWEALGAKIEILSPERHDAIYAYISHFPHAAAFAMVNAVSALDKDAMKYAGPGFVDSTRIALSSPELWANICVMNKGNVIASLAEYKKEIDRIMALLDKGDVGGLSGIFNDARSLRETIGH